MKLLWFTTAVVVLNVSCIAQHDSVAIDNASKQQPTTEGLTTAEQADEWDYLYPKLNSKMARMEQLLSRIERFLGSEDLQAASLSDCTEFIHLAKRSVEHTNEYLEGSKAQAFAGALTEVANLGRQLHICLKANNIPRAKEVLSELDNIRRQNHSKYVY